MISLTEHDVPSPAMVEELRRRFPTERETDELLLRKVARRGQMKSVK